MFNAGELNQRLKVLELRQDGATGDWAWQQRGSTWAKAVPDDRSNLFSAVGIGARGVTFTIREKPSLDLHQAFSWRGQHCFLTSILPDLDNRGYWTVKAALVETVVCLADWDGTPQGPHFPGVLTEKYVGHEQLDPLAVQTTRFVLVTPKVVLLKAGSLVEVTRNGAATVYQVLCPHELDQWKNEYEIARTEDL